MQSRPRLLLLVASLVLAWLTTSSIPLVFAQSALPVFDVGSPGRRNVPIAIPQPKGDDPAVVQEFWSVLRRDLEISGWFEIIDPNAYIESVTAGLRPGSFRYQDWTVPGAVVLAKTRIDHTAEKVRAEVWTYDIPGTQKLSGRAFSARPEGTRTVAHRAANAIIQAVTGTESIFNTRFAAVNARSGNKEIYLVDVDGHGAMPVTRNGSINLQPAWSPTGNALVFTSYRAGNPDLYVADLVKATTRRISARSGLNIGPAWCPLGDRVAVTLSNGGNADIYTIEPYSGKEIARLTSSPGIDASPAWSPGGSQIVFVSERSGGAQIYVMNVDGSGVRRVSFHGSHNTDPAWSPRGDRIAYVTREGHFDIVTCDLEGRGLQRITQSQGDNEDPTWSPDGRYIGFTSTRTGSSHIWLSTADGYHHAQITQDKGGWSNPAWSPPLSW